VRAFACIPIGPALAGGRWLSGAVRSRDLGSRSRLYQIQRDVAFVTPSGAGIGADIERGAEVAYAHLPEPECARRAIRIRGAFCRCVTGAAAYLAANRLPIVSRIDASSTGAAGETWLTQRAGQTACSIGTKRAAWALSICALPAERGVVSDIFALVDIPAARQVLRTVSGAALVIWNACSLTVLGSSRTCTGSSLACLATLALRDTAATATGPTGSAGGAIRLRRALPSLARLAGAAVAASGTLFLTLSPLLPFAFSAGEGGEEPSEKESQHRAARRIGDQSARNLIKVFLVHIVLLAGVTANSSGRSLPGSPYGEKGTRTSWKLRRRCGTRRSANRDGPPQIPQDEVDEADNTGSSFPRSRCRVRNRSGPN
jgi:hypothetical protein